LVAPRSLKLRIALTIFALEAVMMAVVLWQVLGTVTRAALAEIDAKERIVLQTLADLGRNALLTDSYDALASTFEGMQQDPSVLRVLLADARGQVVASAARADLGQPMPAGIDAEIEVDAEGTPDGRWRRQVIANVNETLGTVAVQFSRAGIDRARRAALHTGVAVAGAGMLLIAAFGLAAGWLLTRRLDRLARAAGAVAGGDLSMRAGLTGSDEIAALGQAFDAMTERLGEDRGALVQAKQELEARVEQRTAELARATRAAEQASAAKSEFLSGMSHELRTPLNAVLGFGQLLGADPAHPLTPRQREHVDHILRGGHHLLTLIDEVLDLARIESGRLSVSPEPVRLQAVLDDCLTLIRPLAQSRAVTLPPAGAGGSLHVRADRTRLKQVLLNLLSNAVKYNREGGAVTVDARREGPLVHIEVVDEGPGLTPEQRERLFVPFERLGAEHGPVEGTGIGLALSKRLVALMGGEIGVDSRPGEGSRFWLRLAAADLAAPPPVADAPMLAGGEPAPGGPVHEVLCIEDNPANLQLLMHALDRHPDLRLCTAKTPTAGIELAIAHRPALVLLDIHLPEMDGYAVLRCLREHPATREIPVVAVSANAMPGDVARGRAAGFADYLTKPLDIRRLDAVVDALVRGSPPAG
jgi:signal transduction histidine kinase/ActR/RegA family two-component response regulator